MYNAKVDFIKTLSGLSLIEILVAMAGSLLVLSLLITCYSRLHYHLLKQHAFAIIQHNADSALKLLTKEIHLAGFIGCAKLTDNFAIQTHTPYNLVVSNKLSAYLSRDNHVGFTVRYLEPKHNDLLEPMENTYEIILTGKSSFLPHDILLISNCRHADIFEVDKVINISPTRQKIISLQPLSYLYERNSAVGLLHINSYFIANTHRKNAKEKFIYALYKQSIKGQQMEWMENVDSLFIRYTLNKNGQMMDLEPNQIDDWSKVVGVSLCIKFSHSTQQQSWCSYAALP